MTNELMGDRLARLIKEHGMSQKDFAKAIDATEASVSRYLNNAREPGPKVLKRIAEVLGVTADEIIGTQDDTDIVTELPRIKLLLARNSKLLTNKQKKEIINALLSDSEDEFSEVEL